MHIIFHLALTHLGFYPTDMHNGKDAWINTCSVVVFIVTKDWKPFIYPSIEDLLTTLW